MASNVAAVIVHHRSYDTVGRVVEALLREGVKPTHLVVIDNSEESARRAELRNAIPTEVAIIFEENSGYGAAVNAGFRYFSRDVRVKPDYFLVSTHEAQPEPGAVAALEEALRDQPNAAVAGPTLVSGSDEEFVWSAGGYLRPFSHLPSHFHHREPTSVLDEKLAPEPRSWLDGAFLLYRWDDFKQWMMPERFFLYMEETDLHLNFLKAGRDVLWVPKSRVWQDSRGIPPYYFARNLRLLFAAHENLIRRSIVVPYAVLRRVAADVLKRRDFSGLRSSLLGLTAVLPSEVQSPVPSRYVRVLNPLGSALKHYESEVVSVLSANGQSTSVDRTLEPSASGESAGRWLLAYVRILWAAKRNTELKRPRLLVLWPVLGYWDIVLFQILGLKNVELVVHDPVPLVKAVGYSRWARRLAACMGSEVRIIAHSPRALEAIVSKGQRPRARLLPHPILDPVAGAQAAVPGSRPLIRVLGQYKRDRDLGALERIASDLQGFATLEIHGRGWPEVKGWTVTSGFVEENRLVQLMAESTAIVIPYKNFFQSGIAIRSLELGVPPVGPRSSVLSDMFGPDSKLLVDDGNPDSWTAAVEHAIENGREEAAVAGQRWRTHNLDAWAEWA